MLQREENFQYGKLRRRKITSRWLCLCWFIISFFPWIFFFTLTHSLSLLLSLCLSSPKKHHPKYYSVLLMKRNFQYMKAHILSYLTQTLKCSKLLRTCSYKYFMRTFIFFICLYAWAFLPFFSVVLGRISWTPTVTILVWMYSYQVERERENIEKKLLINFCLFDTEKAGRGFEWWCQDDHAISPRQRLKIVCFATSTHIYCESFRNFIITLSLSFSQFLNYHVNPKCIMKMWRHLFFLSKLVIKRGKYYFLD
jgi:hypothetical protein